MVLPAGTDGAWYISTYADTGCCRWILQLSILFSDHGLLQSSCSHVTDSAMRPLACRHFTLSHPSLPAAAAGGPVAPLAIELEFKKPTLLPNKLTLSGDSKAFAKDAAAGMWLSVVSVVTMWAMDYQ